MEHRLFYAILAVFAFGLVSSLVIGSPNHGNDVVTTTYVIANEQTIREEDQGSIVTRVLGFHNEEQPSPFDWIGEQDINVQDDRVVINVQDAQWARFTDTNSMDPVIDEHANAIEIVPKDHSQIHVGDIVSYKSKYSDGTIIHRVVETGFDSEGWYCIMKGDNNSRADPGKIRFDQIRRVVIAIVY